MPDETPPDPRYAASILFRTPEGQALFLKRGNGGDYPSAWCFPGGHAENGEGFLDAAKREAVEEIGKLPGGEKATRTFLSRSILPPSIENLMPDSPVDHVTFLQEVPDIFEPQVSGEHTGFAWAKINAPPEPLHPGCATAIRMLTANELDIARMMAAGEITSPQFWTKMGRFALFAMRITGTGAAFRGEKRDENGKVIQQEEYAWRNPDDYLTPEFLARMNGLPVIFEHPEKGGVDSDVWNERAVGTVFLPYIHGEEVWCIAKIYDDDTIEALRANQMSTSPGIRVANGANFIHIDGGQKLLIEGEAEFPDHLAICWAGVWDKGGDPSGIRLDSFGGKRMATEDEDKAKKDAEAEREKRDADRWDAMFGKLDAVCSRMDAMESRLDKKDSGSESEEDKEKKKADAESKEKEDAEAKAKADAADLKKRLDEMEGKIPRDLSDADAAEMADAQAKADSVLSAFGKHAPRALSGETPAAYRRRLLKDLQPHSADFKDVDLNKLDSTMLPIAEKRIFADALAFARSPKSVPEGQLRATERRSAAGHTIREFHGDIRTAFAGNLVPSRAVRIKSYSEVTRH